MPSALPVGTFGPASTRGRIARLASVGALALAGLTCRDSSPMGPGLPQAARLNVTPNFQTVAGGPVVTLTDVVVKVFRLPRAADASPIIDTIAPFVNDTVRLSLSVEIIGTNSFEVRITARAGTDTVYQGTDSVSAHVATSGGTTPPPPAEIDLHWASADTLVTSLRVDPRDTIITVGDDIPYRTTARRADNSIVTGVYIGWQSTNPSLTIDQATGVARATAEFADAMVIATMGSGLADTTHVSATRAVGSVVASPSAVNIGVGSTVQLNAVVTATDGTPLPTRPITWFSANTSIATVSSTGLVTAVAAGSTSIIVSSSGKADTVPVMVSRRIPTITWGRPADISYPTAIGPAQLNATATFSGAAVAGTFTYTPVSGTVLNAGPDQSLTVTFVPTDAATYESASATQLITVLKGVATLALSNLTHTYDGTPKSATVTSTPASLTGIVVTYQASGGTATTTPPTAGGTYAVTATLTHGNYQANAANGVLTISAAPQSITLTPIPDKTFGTPPFPVTATATSGLPVSFAGVGACSVAGNTVTLESEGTCVISAMQGGDGNWAPATTVADTFNVLPAPVASVDVEPDTSLVQVGQSVMLSAILRDAANRVLSGRAIAWTTGDAAIATVNAQTGEVSGVAPGTVQIFATSEGVIDAGTVIVQAPPPTITSTRILLDVDTLFAIGAQRQYVARSFNGPDVVAGVYTWRSTNTGVATVNASFGIVIAAAAGETQIIVEEAGGTADTMTVVVDPRLAQITLSPTRAMIFVGDTMRFALSGADALGNPMPVQGSVYWAEYDGTYAAQVEADGLVTGEDVGFSTVYAELDMGARTIEARALVEVVRRVARVEVSSSAAQLTAFGEQATFTAVAYDHGNRPIPDAHITWESVNPSVATFVEGVTGSSVIVRSVRNGVTILRAWSEGTAGERGLLVQQQIATLDVTPVSMTVDIGGYVPLTAIARDANNNIIPLAPGAVAWSSQQPTIVQVDVTSGVVQGLQQSGGVLITATAGSATGNALIGVQPEVIGKISFAVDTMTVLSGDTVQLDLRLNKRPPVDMNVDLTVDGANAAFFPQRVTFNAMQTSLRVNVVGRFSGTVHAIASTQDGPFGADTLTLYVRSGMWFDQAYGTGEDYDELNGMNAGEEFITRLNISEPAPAGGLMVRFESNTAVARVTPAPLLIPAGHLAADVVIRAVGAGMTSITPVVSGMRGTPVQVEVFAADLTLSFPDSVRTIGVGQYEWGTPNYYDSGEGYVCTECYIETDGGLRGAAPLAGTTAKAAGTSSSTSSSTGKLEIPGAPGSWVDYEYDAMCGAGVGESAPMNLNSSANAYAYEEQPPFFMVDYCVRIGTPPQHDLQLSVSSSDRGVLAVEENPIIRESNASIGFAVHGMRPGTVAVTASALGWTPATIPVTVTTPRLWIQRGGDGYADTLVLSGGFNNFNLDFFVGDSLMRPHPRVNSLLVRVTSSDPTVVRIDTTGVVGAGEWNGYVYGTAVPMNPGTAWLRLRAEGHFGDSIPVVVPAREFDIQPITVGAGLSYVHYVQLTRQPNDSLFISVTPTDNDSSTVAIDSGYWYCYGDCYNAGVQVRGYGVGTRQFVFSASGYAPETVTVNVVQPEVFTYPYGGVPVGGVASQPVYVGVGSAVMTTLAEVSVSVARISADTAATAQSPVVIPAGNQFGNMEITGVVPGISRFVMTAPGFMPDTFDFEVTPQKLEAMACQYYGCYEQPAYAFYLGFLQREIGAGSGAVRAFLPQPQPDSTVVHVRSLQNRAVPTVSRLVIPAAATGSSYFGWDGNAVGADTIVLSDSAGRFAPDSFFVDVAPGFLTVSPEYDMHVQADQTPTTTITGMYRSAYDWTQRDLSPNDTFTIELTSSDETVMTVPRYVRTSLDGSFAVTATYVGAGTAFLVARDSAGRADVMPDTSGKITWSGPRLTFNETSYSLGMHQSSALSEGSAIRVALSNVPAGDVTVHLRSTDPRVVVVQDSLVMSSLNGYAGDIEVYSRDTIGVVQIQATADGYAMGTMAVDVGRGRIRMDTYEWMETSYAPAVVYLYLTDQNGNNRASTRPVTVRLTSSNPSVAATDSTEVTIDSGAYQNFRAQLVPLDRGRTNVVASEAGYPALPAYRPDTAHVEVVYPELWVSQYPEVGMAQVDSIDVNLPQADTSAVLVTLNVVDPAMASVSPTSVLIPAGNTSARVEIRGEGREGYTILEISAPRYGTARQEVSVTRGYLTFQGIAVPDVGDTVRVRVKATMYGCWEGCGYMGKPVHTAQDIALAATLAGGTTQVVKFMDSTGTTQINSVRIESRDTITHEFLIVGVGAGGTTITASNPNFQQSAYSDFASYPLAATVTIPEGSFSFVPASVQLAQYGIVTWDNQATTAEHNITFSPTNPDVIVNEPNWTAGTRQRQFSTPGTYTYQCTNHPTTMNGTVTIVAVPPS